MVAAAPLPPHRFIADLRHEWYFDFMDFLHVGLPKLVFIAVVACVLILLVNAVTGRIIAVAERHRTTFAGARVSQVRTLTSVIRATGISIVVLLAVLQIMENVLNFNLGPLLASAGVAGIALGLAAQTIVKDLLNGILILLEDQYTTGDVVTLAGLTGTVESMTLRRTSLRGFDGTLYTIPNSQITNVANQSRGFSVATVNISVDFSANPNEVIPLLRKIANEVRNEPAYKNIFLEDPSVPGVDSIKGSEVIYPISVKTVARQQFDAVREIQRRVRLALEEHNMLPGSPYRVAGHPVAPSTVAGQEAPAAAPDPTAAKPNETNPFTGS
ncbi:MAG TPA: mechanosensitive ion channel family protein [Acidobacteriaceae bacterium]|nr:mechanosensitive ion channel family protein [Acidobacteriaceae bacterium]